MATTKIDGTRQIAAASITNSVQNFGTPSAATDVAIKSYVDAVAQGLDVKPAVRVATIATLSPANTYANGASGVGATLTASGVGILTVDSVATVINDYILVKNQASGLQNGIYKVTTEGTAGVAYVLTRIVEMDTTLEFKGGFTFVGAGTTLATTQWVCSNATDPVIGTTAITFAQFGGAGTYTSGSGITITGQSIAVDTAVTMTQTNTMSGITNKTFVAPVLGAAIGTSLVVSSFINEAQGTNIASATTTDIGAATGNYVNVTGVTTITGLGTVQAGTRRIVNFNGALTLTYNATSLILPTAASIVTVAGDTAQFVSLGAGNWVCISYQRASGAALVGGSSTYQRATAVSGTQNSSNKVFTLASAVSANSEQIYMNGQLLTPGSGNDYTLSSTTITFDATFTAPAATDTLRAYGTY